VHRAGLPKLDLATAFAPISRVLPGLFSAQWRRTGFTIHRLPFPFDSPFLGVELDHDPHDLVEDTQLLPGLEAFMQRAAARPKPVLSTFFGFWVEYLLMVPLVSDGWIALLFCTSCTLFSRPNQFMDRY
jgi:hypothetical protein